MRILPSFSFLISLLRIHSLKFSHPPHCCQGLFFPLSLSSPPPLLPRRVGSRRSKGRQTGSPSKSGKGADAAKSCLAIQGAVTWLGISANYAIRCVDSSTGMKLRTLAYPQYPVLSFLGLFTFLGLLRFIMVLGDENSDPDRAERAEYIAHLRAKEKRLRKMGLSCF